MMYDLTVGSTTDELSFDFEKGQEIYFFSRQTVWSNQPSVQCVTGTLSPRTKRPGREADHSSPSSVKVQMNGAVPPIHHMAVWCAQG